MPIFEYICRNCGHVFEELILGSSKDDDLHCPQCDSEKVEKKASAFATSGGGSGTGVQPSCAPGGG